MKKYFTLLTLFLVSGCSILGGIRTDLTVTASERDAQIFINGSYQGNGTIQTTVPRDENTSILVQKDGFYSAQRNIPTKLSKLGILDAIGGCVFLLPWIGLAFPGAWTLDETNVVILLEQK